MDIGAIIRGIEAKAPAAVTELLDLVDALCDRVIQAEAEAHRGDVQVTVRSNKGLFESQPVWASELEAGWDLLRSMVKADTSHDIGPWPDKKRVERWRVQQAGPTFYETFGDDSHKFR